MACHPHRRRPRVVRRAPTPPDQSDRGSWRVSASPASRPLCFEEVRLFALRRLGGEAVLPCGSTVFGGTGLTSG